VKDEGHIVRIGKRAQFNQGLQRKGRSVLFLFILHSSATRNFMFYFFYIKKKNSEVKQQNKQ
jgi:hypothetical protein